MACLTTSKSTCAVQIDVTMTAKADYAWMWGVQTAVEAIFISQAKDDIAAYLQSNIDFFRDLVAAGKVCLLAQKCPCMQTLCTACGTT